MQFRTCPTQNGTLAITGSSTVNDGLLEIPAEIDGIPVTEIEASAFHFRDDLQRVVLPETIVAIHHHAFAYCENLRYFNIPSSVSYIGDYAFVGAPELVLTIDSDSIAVFYSSKYSIATTEEKQ